MAYKINWKLSFTKSAVVILLVIANTAVISIIPQLMWYWFGALILISIEIGASDWWKRKAIREIFKQVN
jgi:uncharacterized membrane protein